MNRVSVHPSMIRWALERAQMDVHDLTHRLPGLAHWETGKRKPTLKQLEDFAKATRVPFGYMFLPEPPEEKLPIPDFRTIQGEVRRPSPDLLDTIYTMRRRSAWLREDRIECEADSLDFVGSARLHHNPQAVGQQMRRFMGISDASFTDADTWVEAIGKLRSAIEQLGVMAVINSVVGNNSYRKLRMEEFRGHAFY